MARRGHDVFVALRPSSPLAGELSELSAKNLVTLPLRNSLDAGSARELSKFVSRNEIQIVHAHMARDYPLAAFATRKSSSKLVVTRHVLFGLNRLHRITLAKARVIAVSHAVALELSAGKLVSPERISVVHNGIDATRFASARNTFDRQKFLSDWKLPKDILLIGTVGELTLLKGQTEFLKAAAQIVARHPEAFFIVAGTDHSEAQRNSSTVDDLIARLGLGERVRRVSWIDDIAQLYCALDVFVSASHTESFGLAIAEAMACATPVVATETGGAKEIIEPGRGLLVSIGDVDELSKGIEELLGDRSKREAMGAAGQRAIATNFGISKMIDGTERIYREELGE